jgi:phage virion morphogenesis protein
MDIKITVKDLGAIASLKTLQRKLSSLSKPLKEAADYMVEETEDNFLKESDPDGQRWAPLAASTLKSKRGRNILRETEALAGSITSSVGGNQATVQVGTSYGKYHQAGTRKMPQRKIIGIAPKHEQQIKKIFKDHLESLLG